MESPISGSGSGLTFLAACWNNSPIITEKNRIWTIILTQSKRQKNVQIIVTEWKKIVLPCD